jgi:hypothetical protein
MPLVLRSEKGSELTFNEMDGNFTFLEDLAETTGTSGSSGTSGANGVVDNTEYVRNTTDAFGSSKITQVVTLSQTDYNNLTPVATTLYVII